MDKNARIYVSGHTGMVGSAVVRMLQESGCQNLILRTSKELDLRIQDKVDKFMRTVVPEYVFLFAAKVGGIKVNMDFPAEFLYDNIMIEANLIHASYKYKVKKLLYLGSSCMYPRECPQPMKERYLLTGKVEPTNEGYAIAKIVGVKLCEYYNKQYRTNFISLIPPNLYGPNDNFDLDSSHVIAALLRKFHEATISKKQELRIWGSGKARREFLHVNDLARGCVYFMNAYDRSEFINIGRGEDISIAELARLIKDIAGYRGNIVFDESMADGMPQKCLDVSRLRELDWEAKINLRDGIKMTYEWYCKNYG